MISNSLIAQPDKSWPKARKLIFLICLVSFMLQIYRITARYYRYDTEFQLKQFNGNSELLEVVDMPAVTLCVEIDAIFLKSRLRTQIPEINRELKRIDKINTSSTVKDMKIAETYHSYVDRIFYPSSFNRYFERSLKEWDFSECYSLTLSQRMVEKSDNYPFRGCASFSPVLESRVRLNDGSHTSRTVGTKCFTYFSRQQSGIKSLNDLQIDMKSLNPDSHVLGIIITMNHLKDSIELLGGKKSIFMFIHDPNSMPSFDIRDGIEIKADKRYEIRFWSTTKWLMKAPYPSNCYDYHKNFNSEKSVKTRDQCLHNCYIDKSEERKICFQSQQVLFNDDKLRSHHSSHCTYNGYHFWKILNHCKQMCHQNCHQKEYKIDYKETEHGYFGNVKSPMLRNLSNFSLVHMFYQKDKETEYVERPIQSMCATIQALFISLLIWFGISIFSFTSFFETAVIKAKPHMYSITTFEDKVSPSVVAVVPNNEYKLPVVWNESTQMDAQNDQQMVKPKFTPTNIGSNVKLEHYNDFISKVVEGCPIAHTVKLPEKQSFTQY